MHNSVATTQTFNLQTTRVCRIRVCIFYIKTHTPVDVSYSVRVVTLFYHNSFYLSRIYTLSKQENKNAIEINSVAFSVYKFVIDYFSAYLSSPFQLYIALMPSPTFSSW